MEVTRVEKESAVPGLKAAIKRAGYTQTSLAAEIGTAVSTVARWVSGDQEPSVSTVKRLAEILNSSMAELLGITVRDAQKGCAIIRVEQKAGKKVVTLEVEE